MSNDDELELKLGQAQIITPGVPSERSAMTKSKFQPAILTALGEKAYLVRQVAADQGVQYDETPVPGKDQISFSFKKLDRASADKLFTAMPTEVFAKRAIIGGGPPPGVYKKN